MRIRSILTTLLLLLFSSVAIADKCDSLWIYVQLQPNGDARITEAWRIYVNSNITEWYLERPNMQGRQITDLTVTEGDVTFQGGETGWDVDRSRSEKAGQCGLVEKSDGYEICWGVGTDGWHDFEVSYTIQNLVKAYPDADGFNYRFVFIKGDISLPYAAIEIRMPNEEKIDTTKTLFWAFGYHGSIEPMDDFIAAWAPEGLQSGHSMIICMKFEKGLLNPTLEGEGTFEELKERAFEGSDYYVEEEDPWWWDLLITVLGIAGCLFFVPICMCLWYVISLYPLRKYLYRKKINATDGYYWRDVDKEWQLPYALHAVDDLSSKMHIFGEAPYQNVIAAAMLRLINNNKLQVTKWLDPKSGKYIDCLAINKTLPPPPVGYQTLDNQVEDALYHMIRDAAGTDAILQPYELKQWANAHKTTAQAFYQLIQTKPSSEWKKKHEARIYQLRNYLKDFTLVGERNVRDVKLWDEYLIYASLFGIADQVRKDFKQMCPQYYQLSQAAQQLERVDHTFVTVCAASVYTQTSAAHKAIEAAKAAAQRRASGHGGSSSFGGGGGFSGGGGFGGR